MLDKFWEGVAGDLADRWLTLSASALIFWLGGLAAWASAHGGLGGVRRELTSLAKEPAALQVAAAVLALVTVSASTAVVNRLTENVLPLLEGYWPPWTAVIRDRLIRRKTLRFSSMQAEWQVLAAEIDNISAAQRQRYLSLDQKLRARPGDASLTMPTRLGNILRAAEGQPHDRYGLESAAIWPRLWLVLPTAARQELATARSALNDAVATVIWSVLFCGFAAFNPVAIVVGLAVATIIYFVALPARAMTFGALFESAFDLHRIDLFKALRWPLPASPADDRQLGRELTNYLVRGITTIDAFASTPEE